MQLSIKLGGWSQSPPWSQFLKLCLPSFSKQCQKSLIWTRPGHLLCKRQLSRNPQLKARLNINSNPRQNQKKLSFIPKKTSFCLLNSLTSGKILKACARLCRNAQINYFCSKKVQSQFSAMKTFCLLFTRIWQPIAAEAQVQKKSSNKWTPKPKRKP